MAPRPPLACAQNSNPDGLFNILIDSGSTSADSIQIAKGGAGITLGTSSARYNQATLGADYRLSKRTNLKQPASGMNRRADT